MGFPTPPIPVKTSPMPALSPAVDPLRPEPRLPDNLETVSLTFCFKEANCSDCIAPDAEVTAELAWEDAELDNFTNGLIDKAIQNLRILYLLLKKYAIIILIEEKFSK
jgi:hypothetical protein